MGDSAERAGKQTSLFGDLTSKAIKSASAAIAGLAVGRTLFDATKAASDLGQALSTSSAIFGQNAGAIERWSRGAVRSVGLSQRAAVEAAVGFGDMFQQLGFTEAAATQMSTSTVQLAADLGAFRNLETGDVLERIQAALRGEYDSLQLLIPNINAARVEQEALAATGKTSAAALTAQEKAAATLAIVQKDGAKAAGAFAREADGLTGRQQQLTAAWENAEVKLGNLLVGPMTGMVQILTDAVIPAFETVVDVVGFAVNTFGDLPGPIQAALGVLAGVALLRGPLSSMFETVALKALYAKDAIAGAATNVGSLKTALGGLVASAAALATITVLAKAIGDVIEFTEAGDDARETIDNLSDSLTGLEGPEKIDANKVAIQQLRKELEGYQDILDDYNNESILHYLFIGQFSNEDVSDAKEAARLLTDEIERLEHDSAAAANAVPLLGGAIEATGAQAQASQEAVEEWLKQLQGIAEGFVEPLAAYQDLLSQKQEAERASAEATAAATDSASDSWEDYADDVSVSLDEYSQSLQDQLDAQANWRDNLALIAQEAGIDVANYLAEMGEEGVDLVAEFANSSDAEMQRAAEAIRRDIEQGGEEWTAELDQQLQFMDAVGRAGARATVAGIAAELGLGTNAIRRIAAQYGVELAGGVNPILSALGKGTLRFTNSGVVASVNADGNLFEDHSAQIAPGGAWRIWAEPETGGEAYIPLAASKRARSVDIWKETGRRLGISNIAEFAFGGISDVPRPPSTAPYRAPLSTAGDAAMQKEYETVTAWLRDNTGGVPGSGSLSGSWVSIWNAVKAAIPAARINSTFRLGDPGYHGLNKAIDFGYGSGPGGAGSAGLASINRFLFDNYGSGLAELIYDGLYDDRSDIKNGRPLVYSAGTRAEHQNHVHAAVYDQGGVLPSGMAALNLSGQPETVRTAAQEAALQRTTHIVVQAHTSDERRIASAIAERQRLDEFLQHG